MRSPSAAQSSPTTPPTQHTPGVCDGEACVRDTRIPVWLLVRYRQLAADDATLLRQYPGLTADDLAAAWEYARAHAAEIDAAIAAQESDGSDGGSGAVSPR